ncbi:protein of unknown function [Candidatus Methylomirabilis oxygeniifera]|uniref:Uncharacterized protein n=1 Tax=Methylomirabilis oxygeniifera TaxID=671143 RepID=D5MLJ7_METO1|nr:protein of unknown function [Candidatus Methylomirabilis oxyfera]
MTNLCHAQMAIVSLDYDGKQT